MNEPPPEVAEGVKAVDSAETMVRCVTLRDQLLFSPTAVMLGTLAISQQDLHGKDNRSVSVFRDEITDPDLLKLRAGHLNKEADWQADPVVARSSADALFKIEGNNGHREILILPEPIDDELGKCDSHAGIKRTPPGADPKDRMNWAVLRAEVAKRFDRITHLTGRTPSPAAAQ